MSTLPERGPEPPPPGARTMAVVRWVLVAAMAVIALLSVAHSVGVLGGPTASAARVQYYCPMHPQVVQDHPGECPICSMTLVQRSAEPSRSEERAPSNGHAGHRHEPSDPYICPMHPVETGLDASARCPICGMRLEPRAAAAPGGPGPSTAQPAPSTRPQAQPPHAPQQAPKSAAEPPAPSAPPTAAPPSTAEAPAPPPPPVPGLAAVELAFERVQAIGVRSARAVMAPLGRELRGLGVVSVDEARVARVHSRFAGWIEELPVATTGARVTAGQVLASLYNLELLPAQRELLTAQRWQAEGAAPASRDRSQALERDARARLELFGMSASEIERVTKQGAPARTVAVRAPISGHVMKKNAVRGAFVEPALELFEIADLSKVWVLADIAEADAARVRVGQRAEVRVAADAERTHTGTLGLIYPALDPQTRTLRVRIELDNPRLELRPGMYATVLVHTDAARALVIPAEALVATGDHAYVFVVRGEGRFEPRAVRAGPRAGDTIEILAGLAPDEVVVTSGNFLIDSESRLRAVVEAAPSASTAP